MDLFLNLEAQLACKEFVEHGEEALARMLESSCDQVKYAACAIVGIATRKSAPERWSYSAHQFLAQSEYCPNRNLVNVAESLLNQGSTPEELTDLFNKKPRKAKLKKPKPVSPRQLLKLLRSRHDSDSVGVVKEQDGSLMIAICNNLFVADAIDIGYVELECSLEIDISDIVPGKNEIESLRAMLVNGHHSIRSLCINSGISIPSKRCRDPNKILLSCLNELESLNNLSVFESNRLFVDDQIADLLLERPQMSIF